MSAEKNRVEASRWLTTGNEDFATAKVLLRAGRYAQHGAGRGGRRAHRSTPVEWRLRLGFRVLRPLARRVLSA